MHSNIVTATPTEVPTEVTPTILPAGTPVAYHGSQMEAWGIYVIFGSAEVPGRGRTYHLRPVTGHNAEDLGYASRANITPLDITF